MKNKVDLNESASTTKLSENAINTFKQEYYSQFGVQLSDEDANSKGLELLQWIKVIYRPIPKENLDGKI